MQSLYCSTDEAGASMNAASYRTVQRLLFAAEGEGKKEKRKIHRTGGVGMEVAYFTDASY